MKVIGTSPVEVVISDAEAKRIAVQVIENHTGLKMGSNYYHKVNRDQQLMAVTVHSAGSHSFDDEKRIRAAKPADITILRLLEELQK